MRPSVFIGSSTESLATAEAIQVLLDRTCQAEIWNQGTFVPSGTSLRSLVDAVERFDFAILVVSGSLLGRLWGHAAWFWKS